LSKMKDWKSHFIFGNFLIILFIFLLYNFGYSLTGLSLVILVLSVQFTTLFPDIDMKKSKIRRTISLLTSLVITTVYMISFKDTWFYGPIYFVILYFLMSLIPTKHRGITHTFKFSIIFSLSLTLLINFILPLVENDILIWFFIILSSYNLHLLLDKIR